MATENETMLNFAEQFVQALYQVADKEKGNGAHEKTPASFSTYTPLHGSGGIFSTPGLERDIVTAHVRL